MSTAAPFSLTKSTSCGAVLARFVGVSNILQGFLSPSYLAIFQVPHIQPSTFLPFIVPSSCWLISPLLVVGHPHFSANSSPIRYLCRPDVQNILICFMCVHVFLVPCYVLPEIPLTLIAYPVHTPRKSIYCLSLVDVLSNKL